MKNAILSILILFGATDATATAQGPQNELNIYECSAQFSVDGRPDSQRALDVLFLVEGTEVEGLKTITLQIKSLWNSRGFSFEADLSYERAGNGVPITVIAADDGINTLSFATPSSKSGRVNAQIDYIHQGTFDIERIQTDYCELIFERSSTIR